MLLCKLHRTLIREERLQVLVHVVHHNEDVRERLEVSLVLHGKNDVNQFGCENIIFHLGELVHQLKLPNHVAW